MNATFLLCLCLLAISTVGHFIPLFTRPSLFFGVTIEPAFRHSDPARRILRTYRLIIWGSALPAAIIMAISQHPLLSLIAYIVGVASAQVIAHRDALPHATVPSSAIEVDLSAPAEKLPGGLIGASLPLILLNALDLWSVRH